jgi:hypothetical protein
MKAQYKLALAMLASAAVGGLAPGWPMLLRRMCINSQHRSLSRKRVTLGGKSAR